MNFDLGINNYNHLQFLEKLTSFLRTPSKTDSDEREFAESILNLDCDDYRQAYWKAKYLLNVGFNNENMLFMANSQIEKAYQLKLNMVFPLQIENRMGFNLSDAALNDKFPIKTPELLFFGGQIKSMIGDKNGALEYYKKYQLYSGVTTFAYPHQRLYLFRKCSEYAMKDLINNRLSIVKPKRLNDPVDCLIFPWRECLDKNCIEKTHIPFLAKSYDYYRIRSFVSGDNNVDYEKDTVKNTLMWSHYADEHRGLCILYDFSENFINSKDGENPRNYFMKVNYIDEKEDISVNKSVMSVDQGFATKSIDWKYENEVRLISYDCSSEEDFTYINLDNKSKIKAIFFGLRCDKDTINTIKKLFADKPIEYYQMELDYNNIYNLIPKQIE